jgi:hypothetical protein
MMTRYEGATKFGSDRGGTGDCPVCHKPRELNDCSTIWEVTNEPKLGTVKKRTRGALHVYCYSFEEDPDGLAEALNKYHSRCTSDE